MINDQVDVMQVAIFVVLAMTLRQKPDVLSSLLPVMRESLKYQGQDKLPVTVWMIAQVTIDYFFFCMYKFSQTHELFFPLYEF